MAPDINRYGIDVRIRATSVERGARLNGLRAASTVYPDRLDEPQLVGDAVHVEHEPRPMSLLAHLLDARPDVQPEQQPLHVLEQPPARRRVVHPNRASFADRDGPIRSPQVPEEETDLRIGRREQRRRQELLVRTLAVQPQRIEPRGDRIASSACQLHRCRQVRMPPIALRNSAGLHAEMRGRRLNGIEVGRIGAGVVEWLARRHAAVADHVRKQHELALIPFGHVGWSRYPPRDGEPSPDLELIEASPAIERQEGVVRARLDASAGA